MLRGCIRSNVVVVHGVKKSFERLHAWISVLPILERIFTCLSKTVIRKEAAYLRNRK